MASRALAVNPNDRPYTETEYNEPLPRNPLRSRKIPAPVANTDIRKYVSASRDLLAADGWISKPEIPTSEEVMGIAMADGSDVINLMPNQVEGPWQSRETYLRAHYELLREESVALLRDAVAYVRDDPRMDDTQEVCIYDKVHIIGITFAPKGVAAKLQFSSIRARKNIVWEYSTRLMAGSIVALSPANDCFRSKCVVAIVAARPLEQVKQKPHQVDIFFAKIDEVEFDTQRQWIMCQPRSGYFESLRHTMKSLQKMSGERFPLSEHICHLKEVIEAPAYVTSKPVVDLGLEQNVNILSDWPNEPLGDLDQSQWKALRQILSKKLAIVQGPPGTGKTHVSVAALKILLSNVGEWEPPIVVAAQTNHALDQLLNHIAQFEPNFVRLGGRSSDENIKKRTLFEIRQINPTPSLVGGLLAPSKKRLQHIIELVSNLLKPFAFENSEAPLQARLFRDHELLSREQYASMREGARGWTGSVLDDEQDPMATWLGDTQIKYDVLYGEESFKFEEEDMDLEYEQLKEMEAERGLDEELETLKGFFMHLKEGRIGQGSSGISEKYIVDTHLKRNDVWQIPTKHRGAVYNILCKRLKEKILATYRNLLLHYEETSTHLLTGKWERDFVSLKETKVVGMTTTGLSKYRALLSCLKPKIIMIEEAAEVIEAPVVVACVESLEHLILVGDHKQLQGRCDVQDLGGDPFFLDMSMFERLVHNNVDYRTLTLQRRMAPEIRRLLTPIYDTLEDHPSVNGYEKVPGMGDIQSFFFCHSWSENSDSLASKYNTEEAQMVVGFFLYLVFNGTSVKNITVLTFYNGQRKKILKLLKDNRYLQGQYVKVATVDSYQGEENEVVLLSLVRSNEEQKIGFLAVENRVCVAMSRAKRGFYVFGNGQILATVDPLWWEITKIMGNGDEAPRRIGFHLPLTCENHGNKIFVKDAKELGHTNGGCRLRCQEKLDCGHQCPLLCHNFPHKQVKCGRACEKVLPCGHECRERCSSDQCSCECGFLSFKENVPKQYKERLDKLKAAVSEKSRDEDKHTQLVQSYKDFANGGAKQHDNSLAKRFNDLALEQTKKNLDDEAFNDLFSDPSTSPKGVSTVTNVRDDESGIRKRHVEYYNADTSPSKSSSAVVYLLDL